ncbi:MAG: hypothetical protein IJ158_14055 [Treponema sp.]|nr:hypothetical protein [Treponema sp.]
MSNIARHANATLVQIKITDVAEGLSFVIKDNGIGFSEETVQDGTKDAAQNRKHWGVANIKKRVEFLGGTVQFINDGGCTIAIRIKK